MAQGSKATPSHRALPRTTESKRSRTDLSPLARRLLSEVLNVAILYSQLITARSASASCRFGDYCSRSCQRSHSYCCGSILNNTKQSTRVTLPPEDHTQRPTLLYFLEKSRQSHQRVGTHPYGPEAFGPPLLYGHPGEVLQERKKNPKEGGFMRALTSLREDKCGLSIIIHVPSGDRNSILD